MVKLLEEYGHPSREIVVRDARGERRLGVYGEFRGKLIVRNLETNRLSYIRPNDPRIQKEHQCHEAKSPSNSTPS